MKKTRSKKSRDTLPLSFGSGDVVVAEKPLRTILPLTRGFKKLFRAPWAEKDFLGYNRKNSGRTHQGARRYTIQYSR
jgi:hypothetical protein